MEGLLQEDEEPETKGAKKKNPPKDQKERDAQYLDSLRECEHHAIDQFDKTILALTSGAFGVSFAFLKDVVKPEVVTHKGWLIAAWTFWCITLGASLFAFYCAHMGMRYAQRNFPKIRDENLIGGIWHKFVMWLNPSTGITFMLGLISMSVFVTYNINNEHPNANQSQNTNNAAVASSSNVLRASNSLPLTNNLAQARSNTAAPATANAGSTAHASAAAATNATAATGTNPPAATAGTPPP